MSGEVIIVGSLGVGGGMSWVHHDVTVDGATINASSDTGYFVNTSGGSLTVNLPVTPTIGTTVTIDDYRGNSATNNITVSPNGVDYMEGVLADNVIIDIDESRVIFTFLNDTTDTTFGWRYKVI